MTDDDRLAEIRARLEMLERGFSGLPYRTALERLAVHGDIPYLLARLERAEAVVDAARLFYHASAPPARPERCDCPCCELGDALATYDDAREEG